MDFKIRLPASITVTVNGDVVEGRSLDDNLQCVGQINTIRHAESGSQSAGISTRPLESPGTRNQSLDFKIHLPASITVTGGDVLKRTITRHIFTLCTTNQHDLTCRGWIPECRLLCQTSVENQDEKTIAGLQDSLACIDHSNRQ